MNAERTRQKLLALGYTEADLKAPRPLKEEEFRSMSVDLQEWHLLANGKAVQRLDAEIAERNKIAIFNRNGDRGGLAERKKEEKNM